MSKPPVVRTTENAQGVLQIDTKAWVHGPTMRTLDGELPEHPETPEHVLSEHDSLNARAQLRGDLGN